MLHNSSDCAIRTVALVIIMICDYNDDWNANDGGGKDDDDDDNECDVCLP